MGRPDFCFTQRQQRDVAAWVGETATWRKWASAAGGTPAYGVQNTDYFVERTITGLFVPMALDEQMEAGGIYMMGDVKATLIDALPGAKDQIIWSGTNYRLVSEVVPQAILGRRAWRVLLRRAGATG